MKTADYTSTLLVDESPTEAFNAITNMRGWWSEEIEGAPDKLNEEFFYHYKDIHLTKMKLVELVPEQKVVWLVLDNSFNFIQNKTEWVGTKLVFEISKEGDKTKVKFTHEGLTAQDECFEVCNEAWTNYIQNSLRKLITTGKGEPNPKEGDGFNAEIAEKWKLNK